MFRWWFASITCSDFRSSLSSIRIPCFHRIGDRSSSELALLVRSYVMCLDRVDMHSSFWR